MLVGYTDSNWTGDVDKRKSTFGTISYWQLYLYIEFKEVGCCSLINYKSNIHYSTECAAKLFGLDNCSKNLTIFKLMPLKFIVTIIQS